MPVDEPQASQAKIKVKSFSIFNQNITELEKSNKLIDTNYDLNDSKFSHNWLCAQNLTDPKENRDLNYSLKKNKLLLFNMSSQRSDIEKTPPCCSREMDTTTETQKPRSAVNQTTAAEWLQNQEKLKSEMLLDQLLDSSE